MKNIKFKEIVILGLSLVVFINLIYFRYIYPKQEQRQNMLIHKFNSYNSKIFQISDKISNNISIFKKTKIVKKNISLYKRKIEILKNSHQNEINTSNILKTMLLKSKISVNSLQLSNVEILKNKKTYSFTLTASDSLKKIVHLMDIIENYSDNMYIPTYSINKNKDIYNITMTVNFVFVSLK